MVVRDESERGSSGDEGIEHVMDTACVSMKFLEHGNFDGRAVETGVSASSSSIDLVLGEFANGLLEL